MWIDVMSALQTKCILADAGKASKSDEPAIKKPPHEQGAFAVNGCCELYLCYIDSLEAFWALLGVKAY